MSEIFAWEGLLVSGLFFAVAFAIGAIARPGHEGDGDSGRFVRGLEPGLLALLGSFMGRATVVLLLGEQPSDGAAVLLGWAFGLWPGAVDSVALIAAGSPVFGAGGLPWWAAAAGGLTGMMDGLWRTHAWKGLGVLSFPLDVTWGLAGSTNGGLLHLFNFAWAGHAKGPAERRRGAHRYLSGFRFKHGYAFTQGAVMSSMKSDHGDHDPTTSLWKHEYTHVWQNRGFGPLFMLTYLLWAVLLFVPGLIAGIRHGRVGDGIMWWSYYNNPWEVWAYEANNPDARDKSDVLCWSVPAVVGGSVVMALVFAGGSIPLMLVSW